jgi:hypothetical protein
MWTHVTESATWKALGFALLYPVKVKDGRGARRPSADREGDVINLPRFARKRWVILHELAHVATSYYCGEVIRHPGDDDRIIMDKLVPSHGPEYAGILLHLVGGLLGTDAYHTPAQSFEAHRVKVEHVSALPPVTENDTRGEGCRECGRPLPRFCDLRRVFCSDECRYTWHNSERSRRTEAGRVKVCEVCGRDFVAGNSSGRYCSGACRQRAYRQRSSHGTRVINLKDKPRPDEFVYIGRRHPPRAPRGKEEFQASDWANHFSWRRYGRKEALRRYEQKIRNRPDLMARLPELEGKTLACWCKPEDCHGDVLIRLIAERA